MYPILVHIGLCLVSLPRGSTISSTILMIRCLAPAATPGALGLGVYLRERMNEIVKLENNGEKKEEKKEIKYLQKQNIEVRNKKTRKSKNSLNEFGLFGVRRLANHERFSGGDFRANDARQGIPRLFCCRSFSLPIR